MGLLNMTLDLERRVGGLRLRVWGLILNFGFNTVALYGLSRLLTIGDGALLVLLGGTGTVVCISIVARPTP
jgi:hypothetical protein